MDSVQSVYRQPFWLHEKEDNADFHRLYFSWMPTDPRKLQKCSTTKVSVHTVVPHWKIYKLLSQFIFSICAIHITTQVLGKSTQTTTTLYDSHRLLPHSMTHTDYYHTPWLTQTTTTLHDSHRLLPHSMTHTDYYHTPWLTQTTTTLHDSHRLLPHSMTHTDYYHTPWLTQSTATLHDSHRVLPHSMTHTDYYHTPWLTQTTTTLHDSHRVLPHSMTHTEYYHTPWLTQSTAIQGRMQGGFWGFRKPLSKLPRQTK